MMYCRHLPVLMHLKHITTWIQPRGTLPPNHVRANDMMASLDNLKALFDVYNLPEALVSGKLMPVA